MQATPPVKPEAPKPIYAPDPNEVTVFAMTTFRKRLRRFGIKLDDRRRHMYLIGKTGMGKSTLLENMIISDIVNGKGLAVVDPHGDLVEKVLKFVPDHRINDIVYFNPSDGEFPIAFNIVESINPEYKNLIASGLVGVFKKIWADSWGPRLEYILINSILALLDYPGSTLLGVTRLLVDKKYRKEIVSAIQDPVVKSFWVDEYANYSEKFRTEAIAPIQNKVGQFLSSSIIRNIVGQSKSTIDMREIMDSGKILLMNLAKGRVGEENSALLGAMMITKLQLAAMSRVDIPEPDRRDFYLYVDEFQNFATESFANILSEARKYRLNLVIAHQYIEQLGEVVKPAVFGNVGTMIVFRIGAADAAEFETEFEPTFTPTDLVNLPKFHMYMKLMIDGVSSTAFSAIGLPPATGETNNIEKIIRASRERYARPKKDVEEKIMRWAGMGDEAALLEGETEEGGKVEEQPEKMPTLNPREFKERLKLIQGSDQKLVPELAQKVEVKEAQAVSLMDALKGGQSVSFGGRPAQKPEAPKPAAPRPPAPTPQPPKPQVAPRVQASKPMTAPTLTPARPQVQPPAQAPVRPPVVPKPQTPAPQPARPQIPSPQIPIPRPPQITPPAPKPTVQAQQPAQPLVPPKPEAPKPMVPKPAVPTPKPPSTQAASLSALKPPSAATPATSPVSPTPVAKPIPPPLSQQPAGMSLSNLAQATQSFEQRPGGGGQGQTGQPGSGRKRKRRRRHGDGDGQRPSEQGGQLEPLDMGMAGQPPAQQAAPALINPVPTQFKPNPTAAPTVHIPAPAVERPKVTSPQSTQPAQLAVPHITIPKVAPSFIRPETTQQTPQVQPVTPPVPPEPPVRKSSSAPSFIKPTEE